MLHLFNRVRLCSTFKMSEYVAIRDLLNAKHIPYYLKAFNLQDFNILGIARSRRVGSFGVDKRAVNQYIFYVHKKDYEYAAHLLQEYRRLNKP